MTSMGLPLLVDFPYTAALPPLQLRLPDHFLELLVAYKPQLGWRCGDRWQQRWCCRCSQPAGPSKRPRPPLNVPNVVPARPPQKQWETATPDVCTNGAAVTTGTSFLVENAQSVHQRRRSLHQDQASRSTWRSTTGRSLLSSEDPTLHIGTLSKS